MDTENPEEVVIKPQVDFPIIAIGASAGGLEAVTTMFHAIENGAGMAYVLVMHLDPDHKSLMAELISAKTPIDVRQINDGDHIRENCLHIIPPGFDLRLEDGRLRLDDFEQPRGVRRPIDSFFASVAWAQGDRCACVVLSGTGGDGTAGMRTVKELGGLCAVQSLDEARYDGMPRSALATKLVDVQLPAAEIIPRLKSYFDGTSGTDFSTATQVSEDALQVIFNGIRQTVGHDFSDYKRSTLTRRLYRRMQILECETVEGYLDFFESNTEEQEALAEDFLINVTTFFRDPQHFDTLRDRVLRPLVKKLPPLAELRIWTPGCSSGQEPYTIAMLIDDVCFELGVKPRVQIFASDIDHKMLDIARAAQYPVQVLDTIPAKYRAAYTVTRGGKFEIIPKITQMVRFSDQNLLQDPPFSKIDLISCRNLLIYLDESMQRRVLPLFHFSLKEDGYLFLGTSENVTRRVEFFHSIDSGARIFQRRSLEQRPPINLPLTGSMRDSARKVKMRETDGPDGEAKPKLVAQGHALLFEQYAPPFIRVSLDGRILDSSGDLSLFLVMRPGGDQQIQTLLRDGLKSIALALLAETRRTGERAAARDVEVQSPFGIQLTDLIAHPLGPDVAALVFIVKDRLRPMLDEYQMPTVTRDQQITALEEELSANRHLLKTTIEEIETANEELKSSNEEMMSMNEELQSANEELTTANEELKNKIDALTIATSDLDNFLKWSDFAMIVLDRDMRVRHVTQAASRIVPVVPGDQGRRLTEFNIDVGDVDFEAVIKQVLQDPKVFSMSTDPDTGGRAYFVRVTPYFAPDGVVDGVSLTLIDISGEVRLRHALHEESDRLRHVMKIARLGFAEYDVASKTLHIDKVFQEQFGCNQDLVSVEDLSARLPTFSASELQEAISKVGEEGGGYELEFPLEQPDGAPRWIRMSGRASSSVTGRKTVFGPTLDITDSKLAIEHREMLIKEMSHRIKNLFAVINGLISVLPKHDEATETFADELTSRVVDLGRVYDLVRKNMAQSGTPLKDIIETIIKPHITDQTVSCSGPEVAVSLKFINTFALVVHELATNAAKYGALSVPTGRLQISWGVSTAGRLNVSWFETVPGLVREDVKPGFGTDLIEMGMTQLNGVFSREFHDIGVKINLSLSKFADS